MIQFFIPLTEVPTVTHQQKKVAIRNGKPVFYEPQKLKDARMLFEERLYNHRPEEPLDGPIRLMVKWIFPQIKNSSNGQYKTTKPDTDNLNKLLKDVMTDLGFWVDDARVCSEIIEKFWGTPSGIFVTIQKINEN